MPFVKSRNFLIPGIVGLIFWGLSACTSESIYGKERASSTDSMVTKEFAEKVTIEYTDSGFLRARVFSPLVTAIKQPSNPFMEMTKGLKVDFYDIKGDIQSYMTAE